MSEQPHPLSGLAQIIAIKGMEGESRIIEEWKDIVASRHTVRVKQWIGAMAGLALSFVGIGLIGFPVAMGSGWVSVGDVVLLGALVGIASAGVVGGAAWLMRRHSAAAKIMVAGLAGTLVLAVAVLSAIHFGEGEWWHGLLAILGLCVLPPSLAFTFNQSVDLVDPMGWVSAFERQMAPYLSAILTAELRQPMVTEHSMIPWRHAGRGTNGEDKVTARLQGAPDVPDELRPPVIEVPARDDLTLADFLEEANRRGLGRGKWLVPDHPRYICPTSQVRITRSVYDRMVEMAAMEGYVERGGDGDATAWLMEPEDAYNDWCSKLEAEWEELLTPT